MNGPFYNFLTTTTTKQLTKTKLTNSFHNFFQCCFCIFSVTFSSGATSALPEDPEFTDVIENITVPAGRNIKLACSVKNLGSYKVCFFSEELNYK